ADLKVTLILAVVAFGGLLFLAFAAVSSYWVTNDLSEQFRRRGAYLADNLTAEVAQTLTSSDDFEQHLRLLLLTRRATIEDVAYAQVVQDGNILSESVRPEGLTLNLISDLSQRPAVTQWQHENTQYLDFVRRLPGSSGPSYVRLGLSLESIHRRSAQIVRMIGGLSILFTAIGVVGAFALYSIVFRPLERLMQSIRLVSQGEFHATEIGRASCR